MIKHITIPLAFLMTIGSQVSAADYKVGDVLYCQSEVGRHGNCSRRLGA
jgi:hypothetical protein